MLRVDFSQINKGDVIAVALSGGVDSVCLLDILCSFSKERGFSVCAINVEHGIRGEDSLKDSAFCKALAESYGVPFYSYTVNAPAFQKENGFTLEQSARILRYNCFFDAINKNLCTKVAVAHHKNDSVETILFNLFRGSSLKGITGIKDSAYLGKIIRPLLAVSKEEVGLYAQKRQLSFVVDKSNFDENFSRNAIRHSIIPQIKKVFPNFEDAILRFSQTSLQDDEFLYSLAKENLIIEGETFKIPCNLQYPVFSRCLILAFNELGFTKDYEKAHIDAVFALTKNQTGKKAELKFGIVAVREHDFIIIKKIACKNQLSTTFSLGEITLGGYKITTTLVQNYDKSDKTALYFDFDALPKNSVIRTRTIGDEIEKFGGGKKSLKKFLTDKKIPASKKDEMLFVAKENEIFIALGVDICAKLKITETTQKIAKITIEKL